MQNTSVMGSGTITLSVDGIFDFRSFQLINYPPIATGQIPAIIVEGSLDSD
jgi:hypothetical protein